jgi:RNA polymerase sigma-70 factor (ECF subfamily)
MSEPNVRQLVSRAHKRLATERREPVGNDEHRRLLEAFLAAARNGDVAVLEELLAADAISYADGGGVRNASKIPVAGRTRIALFMKSFAPRFWTGSTIALTEANGRPAAMVSRDGVAFVMLNIAASADGIDRLLWVMNPDKLAKISTWA